MKPIKLAKSYIARGWSVIPIPRGEKAPTLAGWQRLRITPETVGEHFNAKPVNIGTLLGEPSHWLVDADIDHPQAVALAREYLPPTGAVFGRASKPESHYLYYVSAPIVTTKFQSSDRQMIVELRATGCQTVLPGSVHPTGEIIEWHGHGEPATVDPLHLLACVKELAHASAREAGLTMKSTGEPPPTTTGPDAMERCRAYVAKLPGAVSGQGGHNQTLQAACEAMRFGLSDDEAMQILQEYNGRCEPPWNQRELAHKLADARRLAASEVGSRLREQRPTLPQPVAAHRQAGDLPSGTPWDDDDQQPTGNDPGARLKRLSARLQLSILKIERLDAGQGAEYDLVLPACRVRLGRASDVLSSSKVRAAIADAARIVVRLPAKKWPRWSEDIFAVAEDVLSDNDDVAEMVAHLHDYADAHAVTDWSDLDQSKKYNSLTTGVGGGPLRVDGRVGVNVTHFSVWLCASRVTGGTPSAVRRQLTRAGYEQRRLAVRHGDSVAAKIYYFPPVDDANDVARPI